VVEMGASERSGQPEIGTGQLIAIAATACGGAAWLFQRLTSRAEDEQPESPPANLRTHLHALVESEPVRAVERRSDALTPVVQQYRDRAGQLVTAANVEGSKRLGDAERRLARQRKRSTLAVHDFERGANRRVRRAQRIVETTPARLSSAVEDRRKELKLLERSVGDQAESLRRTASGKTEEVTTMANEHVKRLQERGQQAAESISSTLRDGSKDTATRVADVREQVASLAKTSTRDVGALILDVREDARKNLPEVGKVVTGRAADLGQQVAEGVKRSGQIVGDRAALLGDRGQPGADTAGKAQATISDIGQKAATLAGPALGRFGERLGHLSDDVRQDPAGVRDRIREQGQGALKSIQSQVGRTTDDAQASTQEVEIVRGRTDEDRSRGVDFTSLIQSNIPSFLAQVTDLIEQAGDKSGSRVKEVRKQGASVVGGAEDQVQSAIDRLGEAARRAAQVGDQAVAASSHLRGTSRKAAHRTADASKDGVESIIWLGAAGVAMYYGILNPEQRATVNKYGRKVGLGLGKVIGEIRGQDQKF